MTLTVNVKVTLEYRSVKVQIENEMTLSFQNTKTNNTAFELTMLFLYLKISTPVTTSRKGNEVAMFTPSTVTTPV